MGGYGFLRFSLPMFPYASVLFPPLVFALSVVAVVYTSLVGAGPGGHEEAHCLFSVAHMGFVTIGVFSVERPGRRRRHLSDDLARYRLGCAVPLCRRRLRPPAHARDAAYGGLVNRMPCYAWRSWCSPGQFGLPGTSGFVGEFLTLIGAFQANTWVAVLARSASSFPPPMRSGLRRVIFGLLERPKQHQPNQARSTIASSSDQHLRSHSASGPAKKSSGHGSRCRADEIDFKGRSTNDSPTKPPITVAGTDIAGERATRRRR